jgi:C4-dicarboxylate-specific signal transduction histidine kinase
MPSQREVESRREFTIQNRGPGMNSVTLAHLGEPFLTTKEPGFGMGLGTFLAQIFAGIGESRWFTRLIPHLASEPQ